MKIETLASVVFTEAELKESLLATLEHKRSAMSSGDPKQIRLLQVIEHARNNTCSFDWDSGDFWMSIDGVCETEEV